MKENIHYVDRALYESVTSQSERNLARTQPSTFAHRDAAEAVLFQEARLLDGRRYEEWLALLTDDCLYWVPAAHEPLDPREEAGVNFDDRRRLLDRVALIRSGYLHAQTPPTRTSRLLANVEMWPRDDGGLDVRSCLNMWSYRQGVMTPFAGAQEHVLVRIDESWRIKQKIVRLLDCDQPLGNIAFIL